MYNRKSDQEIATLAHDWAAGRIFTSLECKGIEEIANTFQPMLLGAVDVDVFAKDNIKVLYEYMPNGKIYDKNKGNPCFFTMRVLDNHDAEKFVAARIAHDRQSIGSLRPVWEGVADAIGASCILWAGVTIWLFIASDNWVRWVDLAVGAIAGVTSIYTLPIFVNKWRAIRRSRKMEGET